jgi:hypothetical protein
MEKYGGMTVNERLWVSGLMDRFDLAVEKKDVNLLKTILKEVELSESNINAILEHLGLIKKD